MDAPHQSSDRKPSFFWQGCLILTPIVILTAFGFLSIRQDWMMVEQEAHQRADELAKDLKTRLSRAIAAELLDYQTAASPWRINVTVESPIHRTLQPSQNAESNELLHSPRSDSQAKHPALSRENAFPMHAQLSASGEIVWPADYPNPPLPPAWVQSETAISELAQLDPILQESDTARRLQLWINFATRHRGELSSSGLPLSTIALARALRELHETGASLTEPLFSALFRELRTAPSVLTEQLLAELEQLASKPNSEFKDETANLRRFWTSSERLRALAREVQQTLPVTQILTTNYWFNSNGERWFAILNESRFNQAFDFDERSAILTNRVTDIRFFPKPALIESAQTAIAGLSLVTPPYLGIRLKLENETLLDFGKTEPSRNVESLAIENGYLTLPRRDESATPEVMAKDSGDPTDAFPSRPRFTVEIGLTHPEILYAQARNRSILVAGAIGSAGLIALLGLLIAGRAFNEQQHLNEMKSNFVSSVSHELRAPIASIRLMAEGLETGRVKDESKRHEYFAFLVRECRRLGSLIENVLDFSRIDQGRKEYEFEPTDLAALVRETTAGMEPQAAERKIGLLLSMPEKSDDSESGPLYLDGRALQQALVNLIDNAIKHSPEGSTVTIGLTTKQLTTDNQPKTKSSKSQDSQPANSVQIWVQDEGDGIPFDEQDRIFQRFYRRGSELRRETQGVGIGLSIVKHIAEAHRGRVTVQSEPGHGSRFTIELPRDSAA